jgi:hypothetical protein
MVSPELLLVGKVLSVNSDLRFAVLEFPPGVLPEIGQRLAAYREDQKVAELKVSGPHRDTITVADLTAGNTQPGDQVRVE